jgi:hypothetical protein
MTLIHTKMFGYKELKSTQDGSGTPNGDRAATIRNIGRNKHPITPKFIIITTTYFKSIDKVHSAVDYLKLALCGRSMQRINIKFMYVVRGVDAMLSAQDRYRWRALVNTAMNILNT